MMSGGIDSSLLTRVCDGGVGSTGRNVQDAKCESEMLPHVPNYPVRPELHFI